MQSAPPRARRNSSARQAFTLIEIVLVLVIIGVILAMSLPNFKRAQEGVTLRGGADSVVYAMLMRMGVRYLIIQTSG